MSMHSRHGRPVAHDIGDLDVEELENVVEPEVLPDRAPDGVRRRSYDKAFEPAVARGRLTVQAAWARGSREAYAIGLQRRYMLTSTLALQVTDNSLSLLEALEILDRQSGGALSELTGSRGRFYSRMIPVGLVALGVLFLLGQYAAGLWERESRAGRERERLSFALSSKPRPAATRADRVEAAPPPAPRVERDDLGRVTRVSGGKPSAVLEEICRLASTSGSCSWMEIRHTEPRYPGMRVGRFTSGSGDTETWSVLIRRNRASGRWVAGTGLRPLQPFPDPEGDLAPRPREIVAFGGRSSGAAAVSAH